MAQIAFSRQLSVLSGRLIIPPSQALAALIIGELSSELMADSLKPSHTHRPARAAASTRIAKVSLAHARERWPLFAFYRALLFNRHEFDSLVGDVLGADFEFLDQLPGRSGVSKAVFHTDGAGDHRVSIKV